jgi:hypothetical protein
MAGVLQAPALLKPLPMKTIFLAAALAALICQSSLFAQTGTINADTVDELSISGSIDTYFHKSFNRQQHGPATSFANLQGFSLGMINLIATYSSPRSGFVADLVVGPRGSDAIFRAAYQNAKGNGSSQLINQMFAYYQLTKKIRVNVGQFNTFLGYETITPAKNVHYSTSYLFTYGPFNHTGISSEIDLSNGWNVKLAVMNPTDYTEFNPFDSYTFGGQLGYVCTCGSLYLNATYGDADGKLEATDSVGTRSEGSALQLDFTGSWNLTEKFTIGLGTSLRSTEAGQVKTISGSEYSETTSHAYYGAALYNQYAVSERLKLALRTEYFFESRGGVGAIGKYDKDGNAWIYEITLSANIVSHGFRFIPEVRIDGASSKIYSSASDGRATNSLASINLAVVYTLPRISRAISRDTF